MTRSRLALLAVLLAMLACGQPIPTDVPAPSEPAVETPYLTQSATESDFPAETDRTPVPTPLPHFVTILAQSVYLHETADANSKVTGSLLRGATVEAVCIGNWCETGGAYFWRGCSSDNPENLGCSER
jgi:hypothetical protein